MSKGVDINAIPRQALADDVIKIRCTGLRPRQRVTVWAEHTAENGGIFISTGLFTADAYGDVDLSTQASTGGSYEGIDSMGLIWSLHTRADQRPGLRIMKKNVTTPQIIYFHVADGHKWPEQNHQQSLATCSVKRWYMGSGVQRYEVQSGRLQATLFLPPGDGPFPGVVDLFGMIGGLVEYRAALMASRGFAALALAYFGLEGLPKDALHDPIEMEYFDEAIDYLKNHPKVIHRGIGIVGVSKGSELAVTVATLNPSVYATVAINGMAFLETNIHTYRGELIPTAVFGIPSMKNGQRSYRAVSRTAYGSTLSTIPVENAQNSHFLFVTSGGDEQVDSEHSKTLISRLKQRGKTNYRLLYYPGAGHLVEPPYAPLCKAGYLPMYDGFVAFGGEPAAHAIAQEDAWRQILAFLRSRLLDESDHIPLPETPYLCEFDPKEVENFFQDPALNDNLESTFTFHTKNKL